MSVSSLDILNLSHSLKDVCEVNCDSCPGLTNTLRILSQVSLIKAHLEYSKQLDCSIGRSGPNTVTLPAAITGKDIETSPLNVSLPEIELPDIQAIIVK